MRHFTIILFLLTSTYVSGQVILFNNTYPKPDWDYSNAVIETHEGNYLMAGSSRSQFGTDYDVNLVLVDSAGNLIWDKYMGQTATNEFAFSLLETSDENYLISGSKGSGISFVVLFDSDGNQLWNGQYGDGVNGIGGYSIGEAEDESFYFVETSQPGILYTTLYNHSLAGSINWSKQYSFANCRSVIHTTAQGYALAGTTHDTIASQDPVNGNIILIKTNSIGDTLWTNTFRKEGDANAYSLVQTPDNGYLIAGSYDDPTITDTAAKTYLIKTDSDGDTLWTKFHEVGTPNYLTKCDYSSGYVLSSELNLNSVFGTSSTYNVITKIDLDGNMEWSRSFTGDTYKTGNNVTQTSDGGFLLTGYTSSQFQPADMVLIKLDSIGDFVLSINFPVGDKTANISVHPNPASEFISFKLNENDKGIREISIFNINGQKVKEINNQISNELEIEINDISNGIYFYEITSSAKERYAGKFVVNK